MRNARLAATAAGMVLGTSLGLSSGSSSGILGPAPLAAQVTPRPMSAGPVAPVPGCTYDRCALRRERILLSERLIVGERGPTVRARFLGVLPIDSLVQAVPDAVPFARRYRREAARGSVLTLLGGVATAVALIDASRRRDNGAGCVGTGRFFACDAKGLTAGNAALLVGGLGLSVTGAWRYTIADRSLNRAIWHYNRALAR